MEGKSWSTALLAGVKYRPSRGPIFGVAYTLSKALRDVEDFQTFPQDQLNRAADKGPADNDRPSARHQLYVGLAGQDFRSPDSSRRDRDCRGRSRPVLTTTSTRKSTIARPRGARR